ncbi:MAG: hypothetical protein U5R14_14955 [Gemmatimonadota bacterium]|nr:hypothetical protein [Gemmatimonadota bacterium]
MSPFSPSLSYPLGALPLEHGNPLRVVGASARPERPAALHEPGAERIWTFTYREEGGDDGGEQIGSSLHGRIVPAGSAVDGPLADLGTASFDEIRDALDELPDREIPIPLPIAGVGAFEALALSNVSVDVDEVGQAIAITATASLPMGSVDVLLLGQWDGDGAGTFALGLEPLIFELGEWVDGVEGTALDELDWSGGILTIADEARTLDGASLPQSVEGFYGLPVVELDVGVSVSHVFDLTGTTVHDRLAEAGLEVGEAELAGNLGVEPGVLFGPPEEREAPSLDLTATLRGARLADTPEWLEVERYALRVTNDAELAARAELEAEAELGEEVFPFLFALDLTADDDTPPVLTGRMTSAWEAPFGLEWLTLDAGAPHRHAAGRRGRSGPRRAGGRPGHGWRGRWN